MHHAGTHSWLQQLRSVFFGVVVVLLGVVLASCSAGSLLTDSGGGGAVEPKGKTVPPIAFQEVTGIPPGKLAELRTAMATAGGAHDIGFVEGSFQSGVFGLSGNFKASSSSAGVQIVYQWQFRDGDGVLIDRIDGDENAGVFKGTDPWAGVSPAVLDRIARRTAEAMARKLNQMGYATRLASLTAPPAELFAMAAPDAHREIDFETLNGPGLGPLGLDMMAGADKVVEHEEIAPAVAAVEPLPGEGKLATIAFNDKPSAAPPPDPEDPGTGLALAEEPSQPERQEPAPPRKAKPGQKEVRAVAVVPVKGSPGGGDAELTQAMRKILAAAGWPVVNSPQPDALTVVGRVKVAPKGDGETVSLRWEVRSPDGKTLGDVKQANDVPAGALDNGWGPAAQAVAEAAATGIFDIVKRYQ